MVSIASCTARFSVWLHGTVVLSCIAGMCLLVRSTSCCWWRGVGGERKLRVVAFFSHHKLPSMPIVLADVIQWLCYPHMTLLSLCDMYCKPHVTPLP